MVLPNSPCTELGYADQLLRNTHRNKRRREESSEYRAVKHVSPTTNICERLFSKAKLVMTALRKKMHPSSLNMILFLKANRHFWPNAFLIQKILNDRKLAGFDDDEADDLAEDDQEDEDDI